LVHLYDSGTRKLRAVVRCPVEEATNLAFAPDGRTLATVSSPERVVRLWDTAEGRSKGTTGLHDPHVCCVAFSPGGQVLATGDYTGYRFWDVATGAALGIRPVAGDTDSVGYTPDGRFLLTGSGSGIQVWSLDEGPVPKKLRCHAAPTPTAALRLAVSPDSRWVATGHHDGSVQLWRLSPDGQLTRDGPEVAGARPGKVTQVKFGPDGKTLLVFRPWEGVLWELPKRRRRYQIHGPVHTGDLSTDGRALAIAGSGEGTVQFFDLPTWRVWRPAGQPLWPVTSLAFSADGRTLFTGSRAPGRMVRGDWQGLITSETAPLGNTAETVRLWDVARGEEDSLGLAGQETMAPPHVVACSPDGRTVAAGAEDGSLWIWAWTRRTLQPRRFVTDPAKRYAEFNEGIRRLLPESNPDFWTKTEGIGGLAFSPDGRWLVAGGSRGSVRVWRAQDWVKHWDAQGDPGGVKWVAFTPDSRRMAISRGGQVRFWDVESGERRTAFGSVEDSPILCGAFAPGGDLLATGSKDRAIRLWDLDTGTVKNRLVNHQDHVTSLAFTPDGKTLASGSRDRTVRLWNVAVAQEVAVLEGHSGSVQAVAFSSDGRVLATGGEYPGYGPGEVFLWRADRP